MQQHQNSIVLFRAPDAWMSEWQGPRGDVVAQAFGTRIIPTAFRAIAKAGDVAREIQALNPDARVGIRAADIGPAVVRECAAIGETVLWLR